jgi:glyoxylase-like metal-dependent hydrolase (beta-lactamase superfamily II)
MIRLAEDFYLIEGENQARFPFCNAFLITGPETVLIDTGIGEKRLMQLDQGHRIDRVIISHSHPDHIAGCSLFSDRHLMLPAETGPEVHDLLMLGERFTGTLENGKKWAAFVKKYLNLDPLGEPDERYGSGDILDFGNVRLEAIHAPGHLADHYCFFDHESRPLLSTDVDFSSFGPWYGNPECTIEKFIKAIKNVMAFPFAQVCSSHKPPLAGEAAEDAFDRFLGMFDTHRRMVLNLCDPPATLDRMVAISPFYNNKLKDTFVQNVFEKNMIRKNLDLLVRDGRVTESDGVFQKVA